MAMEEVLVVNPRRRRTTKRRSPARRRTASGRFTKRRSTVARRRPAVRHPVRRRRATTRRRSPRRLTITARANPIRRRRRRTGSRNPIKAFMKNPTPVLLMGAGMVGGMIGARKVTPFLARWIQNPTLQTVAGSGVVLAGALVLGAKGHGKAKEVAAGVAAGAVAEVLISLVIPRFLPQLSNTLAGLDGLDANTPLLTTDAGGNVVSEDISSLTGIPAY